MPVQISGVVAEQELGLRQMLQTMGMLDSAYWLSWMLFEVCLFAGLLLLALADTIYLGVAHGQ